MSTRSIIGILNSDGTATYVFCHWDGFPSHHGPILMKHYNTEARVRQLLAQGQIEVLDKFISPDEVKGPLVPAMTGLFNRYQQGWTHNDENRAKGVSTFILRDCNIKGWNNNAKKHAKPITAPLKDFGDNWTWQEYEYLFKKGAWYWRTCEEGNRWKKLTKRHFKIG